MQDLVEAYTWKAMKNMCSTPSLSCMKLTLQLVGAAAPEVSLQLVENAAQPALLLRCDLISCMGSAPHFIAVLLPCLLDKRHSIRAIALHKAFPYVGSGALLAVATSGTVLAAIPSPRSAVTIFSATDSFQEPCGTYSLAAGATVADRRTTFTACACSADGASVAVATAQGCLTVLARCVASRELL